MSRVAKASESLALECARGFVSIVTSNRSIRDLLVTLEDEASDILDQLTEVKGATLVGHAE